MRELAKQTGVKIDGRLNTGTASTNAPKNRRESRPGCYDRRTTVSVSSAVPCMERRKVTTSNADLNLLEAIKTGDQRALAALYDKYITRLLGAAHSILKNKSDAEDLMHDVFVEAWQKIDSYDPRRCSVYGWLLMRVRSRAIDRIRSLKVAQKHAMLQKPLEQQAQRQNDESAVFTDGNRAKQALASLSLVQQQVVELGYFQGLSCREIAERCDLPVGTVKSRLSSAVKKLREQLAPNRRHANV